MSHPFITQLENVCQSRRRRHWIASTCWAIVALLVITLVMIGVDRVLGVSDPVGRIFLTSIFVGLLMLIVRQWQSVVTDYSMTPLRVAHEAERNDPVLRDTISSAWEFAKQQEGDPLAGSESLRRAVVLRAGAAVENVDWQELIPRKPLQRSMLGLTTMAVAIGLLNWWLPQALGTGVLRLTNPMNDTEWPREHDLQFIAPPSMLAAGDDLVLQLHDTYGPLPAEITMVYRVCLRARRVEQQVPQTTTENPQEIRFAGVQESLQFRATGGDHQTMPWHLVEVLPAPRLVDWALTIHPPAYTFAPATPWDKHSAILAGSRLQLQGRMDQPIEEVVLKSALGAQITADVDQGGPAFRIDGSAWKVSESDTYRFNVTTAKGLQTELKPLLRLDVDVDQPPQVRFAEPSTDLAVLPDIALPLTIEVTDDMAVEEVMLIYQRSDQSDQGEQSMSLWRSVSKPSMANAREQQRVEYLWQLEPLDLEAGSVVEVHAQAADYQPAIGQTPQPLRLSIVTETELSQQILQRQEQLSDILSRLVREQRDLRSNTAIWERLPEWTEARWATASHAARFNQQQIKAALVDGQQSVLAEMKSLLQTVERNGLLKPDLTEQLAAARSWLTELVDGPLTELDLTLSEITRHTQDKVDHGTLRPLITTTARYQSEAIESLERAIELLVPGNVIGRLEQQLSEIEADQSAMLKHCRLEIAPNFFQQHTGEQAALDALAEAERRQRALANRFAEWLLSSTQAGQRLASSETEMAPRLAACVALGEDLGTLSTMHAAAEQLVLRRLGRSATNQQQVLEDLAELRAQLSGPYSQRAGQRLMALQAAEKELRRLRNQVAGLERELSQIRAENAENAPERLHRQGLVDRSRQIAESLKQLHISRAAQATSEAASALAKNASDPKSVEHARRQIELAQRELAAERRRMQVAVAQREMAQLGAKLGVFLKEQEVIHTEIVRVAQTGQERGDLGDDVQSIVSQIAERQEILASEVAGQAGRLQTLPVFAFLLREAGDSMRTVTVQLHQRELRRPTQQAAADAARQLRQLLEVVQQARQSLSSRQPSSSGGGSIPQSQGQDADRAQVQTLELALGQLRLLKSLQSSLQERTTAYEGQRTSKRPLTELAKELARQQEQLADLARQLVPEPEDPDDQL